MNIQFKKGVLELLVFSLLKDRDHYGYEMVEKISGHINISEGTIYPLLRRLSKEGYVSTYLEESQSGPPRKYYKLTERGYSQYEDQIDQWYEFVNGVNSLLREDEDE
ncbi:PadR family transcriptional regulator [Neofamilia massiliensis]|uniref:PadR family transcriptional regulator n=1 Tax=Neofamilia massiliensis TaxID=1673724 RepID=UPI0006BB5862|nr:PadR family transcriptional regulator [Neofamilia massiliensis]